MTEHRVPCETLREGAHKSRSGTDEDSTSDVGLIAYTGQRREGMECQWSRQDATFPRDIFKYCCREKELKASLEALFETFQLSMKLLHASTLISKRSSGSPAVGSALASGASFPALCTPFHLTTV
ncbi:hypothetical protein FQN60_002252 [Etheostoma spectabile]|uniref:Uncharacterized protein n=1 Tax=Etheostoma spectabile TaxID=54343 RepID=A0A5J5DC21_9PERO|nr:hypothetical protein FQN60_002252 [Etheostoma spectabile]